MNDIVFAPREALPEWQDLQVLAQDVCSTALRDLFAEDKHRFERLSLKHDGLLLDYSKQKITAPVIARLLELARTCETEAWIDALFMGNPINTTEQRPALHTALRQSSTQPVKVDHADVIPDIHATLDRIQKFVEAIHLGKIKGHTGQPFTDVVNIGIGGSDLGPQFVVDALGYDIVSKLEVHFVSNVDDTELNKLLQRLNPDSTLFLIASKSFSTQETRLNAESARQWIETRLGTQAAMDHFVGISSKIQTMTDFGVPEERCFRLWDWVGGRFSVWSSIGLSIALGFGMATFRDFLGGAERMDQHFAEAPLDQNLPVVMSLLDVWNRTFLGSESHAILPYDHRLQLLPAYLQQLEMESNGKSVDRRGVPIDYHTSAILWGGTGTNVQHSFMQALHQGSSEVAVDFIAVTDSGSGSEHHHQALLSHAIAQAEALMVGRIHPSIEPHRQMAGNHSSNFLLLDQLNAQSLGALMALYEHKTFVNGVIWGINSFDQWGVELGKELSGQIFHELQGQAEPEKHDTSTNALIRAVSKPTP